MKVYAKPYKTYEGARKRMLLEKACAKVKFVWGVQHMPSGFHVTRRAVAEFDRENTINLAVELLLHGGDNG